MPGPAPNNGKTQMRPLVESLDRLMAKISTVADYVAGFLLLVLTIDIFAEVVFRYILGMPIRFSSELAMIVFPWMVFFSAVMITRADGHIGIVIFRHAQKGVRRKVVEVAVYLFMMAFSGVMLVAGWDLAMGLTSNTLPITGLPKTLLYLAVPMAFFLFVPTFLVRIAKVVMADANTDLSVGTEEPPHAL